MSIGGMQVLIPIPGQLWGPGQDWEIIIDGPTGPLGPGTLYIDLLAADMETRVEHQQIRYEGDLKGSKSGIFKWGEYLTHPDAKYQQGVVGGVKFRAGSDAGYVEELVVTPITIDFQAGLQVQVVNQLNDLAAQGTFTGTDRDLLLKIYQAVYRTFTVT
jgi:hypothetical protein